jgi:hypothetical protein
LRGVGGRVVTPLQRRLARLAVDRGLVRLGIAEEAEWVRWHTTQTFVAVPSTWLAERVARWFLLADESLPTGFDRRSLRAWAVRESRYRVVVRQVFRVFDEPAPVRPVEDVQLPGMAAESNRGNR